MSEAGLVVESPPRAPDVAQFLLRGAGLYYLATLVGVAGRVAITLLIAQALGAAGLGVYTLAFATVQALTMLAVNGQDTAMVRFAGPAHQNQDRPQLRALLEAALGMGGVFALVCGGIMILLFPHIVTTVPDAPWLGGVFALAILPGVLTSILGSYGLASGRTMARAIPDRVVGTLVQVGLTFLVLRLGWGLWGVALAYVCNTVASLGASLVLVRDLYPRNIASASRRRAAKTIFAFAWKLGLSNVAGYVLLNAALFVLGYVNPTQAGLYAAASRLTLPGLLFLESFGSVFSSHAARKLSDPSLQQDMQRVTNWMVASSAPVFILLFAFADTWMNLLGPEFAGGAPVLRLMAFAQLVNMLTGTASVMVGISHRPGFKVVNNIAAWGLNLVLVLLLVPQAGALGAAIAYTAAIVVIDTLEYSEARWLVKLSPFGWSLLKPLFLIVASTLVLVVGVQWVSLPLWGVIALALVFVASYAVLMLFFGLPKADARAVLVMAREFRGAVRR